MVGGVLEANQRWDIGREVMDFISKDYPGALPIRPKVIIVKSSPSGRYKYYPHYCV